MIKHFKADDGEEYQLMQPEKEATCGDLEQGYDVYDGYDDKSLMEKDILVPFLNEMKRSRLLTKDGEIELAKKMENGRGKILNVLNRISFNQDKGTSIRAGNHYHGLVSAGASFKQDKNRSFCLRNAALLWPDYHQVKALYQSSPYSLGNSEDIWSRLAGCRPRVHRSATRCECVGGRSSV